MASPLPPTSPLPPASPLPSPPPDLTPLLSLTPPLSFGDYTLSPTDKLGNGQYGTVYACQRRSDKQRLAVKAIDLRRRQLPAQQQRQQTLLDREAEILTCLPPHDHIVRCIDVVTQEDNRWLFFVFERLQGNLLDVMNGLKRPLRPREACHVLGQLVDGLIFLHKRHIIHRDLKLENVLIVRYKKEDRHVLLDVKIADFGLSKILGENLGLGQHSSVGSPQYVAPEVRAELEGVTGYDLRADIWSLGILFCVMLCADFPRISELDNVITRLPEECGCRRMARVMLKHKPEDRVSLEGLQTMLGRPAEDEQAVVVIDEQGLAHASPEAHGSDAPSPSSSSACEPGKERVVEQRKAALVMLRKRQREKRDESLARRVAARQLAKKLAQEEEDAKFALQLQMQEEEGA